MSDKGLGIKGWLAGPEPKNTQRKTEQQQAVETKQQSSSLPLDKHRIAVLPLVNISPSPADEYFADGMTEELISAVSRIRDIRTISRTSVMKYKGTTKSVDEIARELNVGTVLEGSVRKAGNKLRINMQLIDVQSDEPLCSESFDRDLEDVFAIQSDIANCVAETLQIHLLAREKQRIEKRATTNMEAYTLYLKGLQRRGEGTEEGYKKAIQYFEDSLKKDPKFAFAYSGIADCYENMADKGILPPEESFPRAKEYARKALEIDESLAEAHATLGAVLCDYDFDQIGAEKEYKRALSLNPNFGRVCRSYGVYLAVMGRMDEAVAEISRAQDVNPFALDVCNCAAVIFNAANQPAKSLAACERMLSINENYFPAYQDLAETYLENSRFEDAVEVLQKAVAISNGAATVKGRLAFAQARAGRPEEARKILRELEEESKKSYVSPMSFATAYCGLEEKEQALKWLERAYEERAGGITVIKVRPMWATLRSEPRFDKLVNKMGLKG